MTKPQGPSARSKEWNSIYCFVFLFSCLIASAMHGQSLPLGNENALPQNAAPASDHPEISDALGRSTPYGTVFGFLDAARNGRYDQAAQYLEMSNGRRIADGEDIAHQLYALMNRAFVERLGVISDHLEGSHQLGVPRDRERIGAFRIDGTDTNVDLVHVPDPASGQIWLFSSQVVSEVPDLFAQMETGDAEVGPSRFRAIRRLLDTFLRRLIAFILLIPISVVLGWIILYAVRAVLQISTLWRRHTITKDIFKTVTTPMVVILAVICHQLGVYLLGLPLTTRLHYQRITSIVLVAGVAWLVFRLINVWSERARVRTLDGSEYRSGSIILLGQRVFKVLTIIIAGLITLSILGFEITTAVAGLGIGSLALAFAAQKTLENLLGGISILGDEVIRIGETCKIGESEGTVEDISLRSTRIRTLECTQLSVPNGQLANMNVENISRRDKSLFRTRIGLRYETSPSQLQSLLAAITSLLRQHPKVDSDVLRVHFVGFGESSLDLEINCHIMTSNIDEFMTIREELLLRIMELVADAGTALAIPGRAVYMTEDKKQELLEESPKQQPRFRHRSS